MIVAIINIIKEDFFMNKNFIIMNKNNNTQMQASSLVKFNFNNEYFSENKSEFIFH